MDKFRVLDQPTQELRCAMTLTVLEGSGNIEHGLALSHVMLTSSQDFAMSVHIRLRVPSIVRYSNAELIEGEVFGGG